MSDGLIKAIAEQVLGLLPDGTKDEWGGKFLQLAKEHDDRTIRQWVNRRLRMTIGQYVTSVKAENQRRLQNERLMSLGLSAANGRPVSPVLSVRGDDGSRQGVLWVEATPKQFIEAVFREQSVIDGRAEFNAKRMVLAELISKDADLMRLGTLAEVCKELDIDPDTLGLEELSA